MKTSFLALLSFCIVRPIDSAQAGGNACKTDSCGPKMSSKDRAAKCLEKFDANNDGALDQQELEAMIARCRDKSKSCAPQSSQIPKSAQISSQSKSSPDTSECAANLLEKSDKNGDGKLSRKEITAMIDACGKGDKKSSSGSCK